jgi:CDP-L-myo-inositol myo-inositolphosphotransferase
MTQIVFSFASAQTANGVVAGVPAIARLARAWRNAAVNTGVDAPLRLHLRDGGHLDARATAEIERVAGDLAVVAGEPVQAGDVVIDGENLPEEATIAHWLARTDARPHQAGLMDEAAARRALAAAAHRLVKATGKAGDGMVSRWLNRPVSQAISHQLLKLGWVRPDHATVLTAIFAIAMFGFLVLGNANGLMIGAVLFQCASIVDGVDGEIARATWRSSARGAMLDSATDAATNLGFIAGVIINRWQAGAVDEAISGLIGLVILLTGLAILGARAKLRGEPLNFDGGKKLLGAQQSRLQTALRYITMRDFYCLFLAVMVLCGLLSLALIMFATAAGIWLATMIVMLALQPRPGSN